MIKEAVAILYYSVTWHDHNGHKFGQNQHFRTKLMPSTSDKIRPI